eukprot:m.80563 g.80563  ORF g.80563 m.80563 type:complete len:572 (+) comp25322_c0_seq1:309-2024(+)
MTTIAQPDPPPVVSVPDVAPSVPFLNAVPVPIKMPPPPMQQMATPIPQVPLQIQMQMPMHGVPSVMPGPGPLPPGVAVNPMNGMLQSVGGIPQPMSGVPLPMQMAPHMYYTGPKMPPKFQQQQHWGYQQQQHQQQQQQLQQQQQHQQNNGHHRGGFPGKGRRRDTGELSKNNIYINCLKSSTKDEDLKALCQSYGPIISAKAIIDRETNQCKGYGFVMFEKESSAKLAVNALVRKGAQAAFAKVTRAQVEWQAPHTFTGRQEADPTNLYLTNLPNDQDEAALSAMLIQCLENVKGEVVSCRILREPDGTSSGMSRRVGLARMDCREACEVIIKRLNGCILPGCVDPLRVKFANSPSPRKSKYLNRRDVGRGGRQQGFPPDVPYELAFMPGGEMNQNMPDLSSLRIDPAAAAQNPYIPQAMMVQSFEKRQWAQADATQRGPMLADQQSMALLNPQQMFERAAQRQGHLDPNINFGDVDSIFSPAAVAQANAQRRAQDKFNETMLTNPSVVAQPYIQQVQQVQQVQQPQQVQQLQHVQQQVQPQVPNQPQEVYGNQYDIPVQNVPGVQFGYLA